MTRCQSGNSRPITTTTTRRRTTVAVANNNRAIITSRPLLLLISTLALLLLSSSSNQQTAFAQTTTAITTQTQPIHELATTYSGGWIQDGVMFDVQTVSSDDYSTSNGPDDDGITIFGLNIVTPLNTEFCIELYTKVGTFVGSETDPMAWTFLGSFTIMGQGVSQPTPIPLGAFDPIALGLGDVQGFYVTTQNEKLRYSSANGDQTGDVVAEEVHGAGGVTLMNPRGITGTGIEDEHLFRKSKLHDGEGVGDVVRTNELTGVHTTGSGGGSEYQALGSSSTGSGSLSVQILVGTAKNYPFAQSWPHRIFNGALLYKVGRDSNLDFLTQEQRAQAWNSKRGQVTCDVAAVPMTSITPTVAPIATAVASPSPMSSSDSSGTTEPPSGSSTDLLDTIRKVGTTLYGGMKQSGCMFDIRVPSIAEGGPPEGVTIMALEVSTFLTTETCFEVYTKTGTYEGYEGDIVQNANGSWGSPTWSILGASTVVGQGEELPTHLPIGSLDPVHVLPGQRQAFYVTMTTPQMRYTAPMNGEDSGTLFNRSPLGHLEILVGSAVAYPFDEVWSDRIFNGAVVYALGDVPDGRYNDMTAGERKRTCYVPPSDSSVVVEEDETTTYTTPNPTYRPSASPTPPVSTTDVSTVDPSSIDSADDPPASSSNDQQDDFAAPPRLSGTCPSAYLHDSSTKEVNVPYEYTMVTESSSLAKWMKLIMVATEMENAIHRSLMEDKCGGAFGKRRGLQGSSGGASKVIVYKGFNSKPEDKVTNHGCDDVILGAGQLCNLVQGGVTAMVQSSANEMAVRSDLESYIGRLISDPATFEGMGVAQVAFAGDKIDTGLPVPGGDQDPEGIYTQDGSTTPEDQNNKNSELIKTIIILAVCVSFFIVLSMELKVRRERRNARAKAAQEAQEEGKGEKSPGGYEEGDDSDSDPGDTYGDTALASMSMTSSSYRRERRRTRGGDSLGSDGDDGSMTLTTGAGMSKEPDIILQDLEDMSQFSNADQSGSSSLMALDSTKDGLRGSSGGAGSSLDGSTGSSEASYEYIKKVSNFSAALSATSAEYAKRGQSIGGSPQGSPSSRYQQEHDDTVDL